MGILHKSIVFTLLLSAALFSFKKESEGSATAYIHGVSDSGRTVFSAEVQDIDAGFENAVFKIDGETIQFDYESEACVVSDLENGVYTLSISSSEGNSYKFLEFVGIPSTFKAKIAERHKIDYRFRAKIRGSDPRPNEHHSPTIILNCTLKWEI